jgi:small-conductance mechanosensitive channel
MNQHSTISEMPKISKLLLIARLNHSNLRDPWSKLSLVYLLRKFTVAGLFAVALVFSFGVSAQETPPEKEVVEQELTTEEKTAQLEQQAKEQASIQQLREVEESLKSKIADRKTLRKELQRATEDAKPALEKKLLSVNDEIALLEKTFEQIAIGDVDLSVLGVQEKKFDWREELVLIVQPLIENIKGLTEKPRKIESLRRIIEEKAAAVEASQAALKSIERLLEKAENKDVEQKLNEIKLEWLDKKNELERESQLAEFQLNSLEGKNVRWLDIAKRSLTDFVTGRGLTIVLVVLVSLLIWAMMAGLLWLFKYRSEESADRSVKVHYRLAAYAYRALTALLIAIGIMSVLYLRQDLLLLAIVVLILVGLALAFKNLLPRYIAEGRLLLNMGSVRERERVMYNGIPWRVSSINMYSRLVNPKISGSLRVPISELHGLISRPSRNESWFPSSAGDWILNDDQRPLCVVNQGPEMVELRDLDRVNHFMATPDYFNAGFRNLSSGENFRVAVRFGIDYALQRMDVAAACKKFTAGLEKNFSSAPFKDDVQEVRVEFDSAGDSSLNYVLFVILKPNAARHHNRVKRRIQAACVTVCNEEGWGIPFPQLTVHRPDGEVRSDSKNTEHESDQTENRKSQD